MLFRVMDIETCDESNTQPTPKDDFHSMNTLSISRLSHLSNATHLRHYLTYFVIAIGLASVSVSYGAEEFYKWVDKNGVTHYGKKPPENQKDASKVKAFTKTSSDQEASRQRLKTIREGLKSDLEARNTPSENADVEEQNQKIREENCKIAKNRLKTLQENARVRQKKENGEYEVISEESRQKRIKESEELIQKYCSQN